jgi:hypothetical protein
MNSIYIPSSGPDDWRRFLAKPDLHWATGYSARTLANSWETARGLPPEVAKLLAPAFGPLDLLLAIPEHQVPLPGGRAASQCDVFALLRSQETLITCAIEGKVDEPFGPTVGEWQSEDSPGKWTRLTYLCELLGFEQPVEPSVRYQLLHRTASAVIEARRFNAGAAAMVVHSFSPTHRWRADFEAFAGLFRNQRDLGETKLVSLPCGLQLCLGWAPGDPSFLVA